MSIFQEEENLLNIVKPPIQSQNIQVMTGLDLHFPSQLVVKTALYFLPKKSPSAPLYTLTQLKTKKNYKQYT